MDNYGVPVSAQTISTVGSTSTAGLGKPTEGAVGVELGKLDSALNGLHEVISELDKRVSPILLQQPDSATAEKPAMQSGSPLANALNNKASSIDGAKNRIISILKKIDL